MRCRSDSFTSFTVTSYRSELLASMAYLIDTGASRVLIDPHEDDDLLEDLPAGSPLAVILTHEHFDHISGVNWARSRFDVTVTASRACAERIAQPRNGTELFPLWLIGDRVAYRRVRERYRLPYHCTVDRALEGGEDWLLDGCRLRLFPTLGHTASGLSVLVNDAALFPGDVLLGNGEEFRSLDADSGAYRRLTLPAFEALLTRDVTVFPGHGEPEKLPVILKKQGSYHGA